MSFSAMGRSALAFASVVVIPSAAMSEATRLAIIERWCSASPPKARAFRGVAGTALALLDAQRQAALVELLDDLVEALLPEVGDGQQVVFGALDQLADAVDLGPLEAVARALGQVELLDRQVKVERCRPTHGRVAQLEAPGHRRQLGQQADQVPQGLAGRGQRLLGRDGTVGLDVE